MLLPSLVGVGVVVWLLVRQGTARHDLAHLQPAWLALGLVLGAMGMVALALAWRPVIALVGGRPPTRWRTVAAYFAGELGKYVPGGIWSILGRGEIATREGVDRAAAYGSVLLSLLLAYAAAAILALILTLGLVVSRGSGPAVPVFALAFPLALVAVHPAVLGRALGLARRASRRPMAIEVPAWGASLRALVYFVPAWAGIAAGTWAVARSVRSDVSPARIALATIASWLAGFLAGPIPAGAGVREAVFVAASGLAAGPATAVAVAARGVFVVIDGVGGALGLMTLRRRRAALDATPTGPDGAA